MSNRLKLLCLIILFAIGPVTWLNSDDSPPSTASKNNLNNLEIVNGGFPKAFFHRQPTYDTEREYPGNDYNQWEALYTRLKGGMGLMVKEEEPGSLFTMVPSYFGQLKINHPDQMALFQIDGFGRNQEDQAERYFAGHWLYFEGCGITRDLTADCLEIYVDDTSMFTVDYRESYNDPDDNVYPDQICICHKDPLTGELDWNLSEQVNLVSKTDNFLIVERPNPSPVTWLAGRTYVVPHVMETFANGNRLAWVYNLSTTCPTDTNGKTASDIFVQEIVDWFSPGGFCEAFDGIELDVSVFTIESGHAGIGKDRIIDVDTDGSGDNCIIDGVNVYGVGTYYFHQDLRAALGHEKFIFTEINGESRTRSIGILTGVNTEGFPNHFQSGYPGYAVGVTGMPDWAGGINRLMFWKEKNTYDQGPRLNYVDHTTAHNLPKDDWPLAPHTCCPLNYTRLVFAVAQCVDAAVNIINSAYWYDPDSPEGYNPPFPNSDRGVWDELCVDGDASWLGYPEGDIIRLGLNTDDLLNGSGVNMWPQFVQNWTSVNADISVVFHPYKKYMKVQKKPFGPAQESLTLQYENLNIDEGDLLIYCELHADPMVNYPPAIPRLLHMSCDCYHGVEDPASPDSTMTFVGSDDFLAVFYWRDAGGENGKTVSLTIDIESDEPLYISNFTIHQSADAIAREFENGVVLVNPSLDDYEFNLTELFPDVSGYQKLEGDLHQTYPPGPGEYLLYGLRYPIVPWSNLQDLWVNTGDTLSENPITITLGERDAIFLKKL